MPGVRRRSAIGSGGLALGAPIVATLLLLVGPSRADELDGVSWRAPASCPNEAAVRNAVRQWLEASAGPVDFRAIHVVARVTPSAEGFALDLSFETKSGRGHETLVAVRCETLADIVALKVALAADPVGTIEASETPEEPKRLRKRPPEPTRYGVRVGVGAGFGPLPGVGPAGSLTASVMWRHARLELGGGYWFPKSARYEALPDVGADFSLFAATFRVCAAPKLGQVEFPTCAGLEAGDMRGTGFGVANVESADRPWIAAVLGPALAIPLSEQLFLWLEGDALLGILRPQGYGVRNLGTLYRPEIGAARLWGGFEVRFW
jgi:hypothetical protein